MKIVIVGGGKVGYYLAKTLVEHHHEPTIVEIDKALCAFLADDLEDVYKRQVHMSSGRNNRQGDRLGGAFAPEFPGQKADHFHRPDESEKNHCP